MEKIQPPRLINVFAIGLIVSSLWQMTGIAYSRYIYLFQDLPQPVIFLRYALTWFLRILGLVVGIGLLLRKDLCRKLGMGLCGFTIVTICLKHPYAAFDHNVRGLVRQGVIDLSILRCFGMSYSSFVWTAVITTCLLDVLFAIAFILYFRRASVWRVFH